MTNSCPLCSTPIVNPHECPRPAVADLGRGSVYGRADTVRVVRGVAVGGREGR